MVQLLIPIWEEEYERTGMHDASFPFLAAFISFSFLVVVVFFISFLQVMEKEALRLLSWLASSQAAEDINSDDELARETILTPLLQRWIRCWKKLMWILRVNPNRSVKIFLILLTIQIRLEGGIFFC
ncbi:hypothetical protein RHSIM_Rhsim06G0107500 [Rhododendron simsii]|uniref:Uncharacterized protein n=1 Tax=Rhododendron simsii TaxID=118357 RepID=A0A834GQI4_RHOSS|nr:hypothetical protein RHSIM_Rhsim06G0107500 [Rhododendron simsii]